MATKTLDQPWIGDVSVSAAASALLGIATGVVDHLGLGMAVGVGLTAAALAMPEERGGVVAPRVRRLAMPAAALVASAAVLHVVAPTAKHQGAAALTQTAAYALVAIGLLLTWRHSSRWLAGGVAAAAVVTAAIPEIPLTAPTLDVAMRDLLTFLHITGALVWVGGLVVLSAAGLLGRRNRILATPNTARDWSQVWERFTVVASFAVGALIVSGTWLAWTHVGTPAQLLTTTYGRYLSIKLVVVALMLAAGGYNTRVLMPKIAAARRSGDDRSAIRVAAQHFPVVVAGEAALGVVVLTIVPFLRGSARTQAGWPSAGPFDASVLGTGLVLVALVAAGLWVGTRAPRSERTVSRPGSPAA
jgi:putative copper export protein